MTNNTIELDYSDLVITALVRKGNPEAYRYSFYGEPDEDEYEERTIQYTYTADKDDVIEYIEEVMDNDGIADALYAENDENFELGDYVSDNFDSLFKKYKGLILEHFREDATEEAETKQIEDFMSGSDYED